MNEYIKEQLKKTKAVSFYDKNEKQISINNLNDQTVLIVKEKNFENKSEDLMLFTFEDYLVKPFDNFDFHIKFNKGINIPLNVMQGRIIRTIGKMYYLNLRGFYFKSDRCVHCLKEIPSDPICSDCFKTINVNDIEEVTWEGYVPIKSIKEIIEL